MIFLKAFLFSKFKELWKIIVPFLLFLTASLSLIIGILSFDLNMKQNLNNVWHSGNFRNIEYNAKKFSPNKTQDENLWSFRKNEFKVSFIEDFINQDQQISKVDKKTKIKFLEDIGINEGYVKNVVQTEDNKLIFEQMIKSEVLNLKFFNYNLIDAFIIEKVFDYFPPNTNIFSIRDVGSFKSSTLNKKMKFYISPTNKINNPKYLMPNSDNEIYVFDSLSNEKLNTLDENYIYLTPADLKEIGLKIGDNYKFKIEDNIISTTIAGTAITKTTIPKEKDIINVYAPYSFLQKNKLILQEHYGAYINDIGDDYNKAEKYFNELLNIFFYNDNLNMYKANYTVDYKQSPYFTIYKTPLFIFGFLTFIIILIIIILIIIIYIWISHYAIKQQSEILWTLKANGVGNWVIGLCQIIGDVIPQVICILFSIPFSILFYNIFRNTIIDKYAFNFKANDIDMTAVLVVLGIMVLMFVVYSFINYFVITKQIKIQSINYKTYPLINLIKKPLTNNNIKYCLLISAPNISKSLISGILLFLVYFFISFGTSFNSSLYTSANQYKNYMKPYKNYSGQYISQSSITEDIDEISAINFESLKSCNFLQNCLDNFIQDYKDKDPRSLKISSQDVEWLLKLNTNNDIIKAQQSKLLDELSTLWDLYNIEFYPEIYFKNFPPILNSKKYQSTFNLEFKNEINYIVIGIDDKKDIYKQFNLIDNEVVLNYKSMYQFKKWGYLVDDNLSLLINGQTYDFKVISVDENIIDDYYVFINKSWLIKNLFNGVDQRNNMFYSETNLPITSELIVLPSSKTGNTFLDYYDSKNKSMNNLRVKVVDYNEVSKLIIKNLNSFGNLAMHSSTILFIISLNIILILISLTIISNKKIIITLKQMGYKDKEIIYFIMAIYILMWLLFLIVNYFLIYPVTSKVLTMMSDMAGAKLLTGISVYSFVFPAIIFILFILTLFASLKIYLSRVKII